MKPAAVVLGVLVLGLIWPLFVEGERGMETRPGTDSSDGLDPTLERVIESNVRVLAESVREAERLERLFRTPR